MIQIPEQIREALRLVWSEMDSYIRRRLVMSFILLAIAAVLGALTPVAYKMLIDAFTGHAPGVPFLTPALLLGGYVAVQYVARATAELRTYFHATATQRLSRRLANRLFAHIVLLPLRYHLDRKTGAIGGTLGQGISGCQTLLQHVVFTLLPVTVEFVAMIFVLVYLGHATYLAILGPAALAYGIAFSKAAKAVLEPSRAVSSATIETSATLTDSLLNYETVKYFNAEPVVCNRYDEALLKTETVWRKLLVINRINGFVIITIFTASLALTLGYAGYEVLRGTITVGDFVLLNTYVARLVGPIESLGLAVRSMSQAMGFLQKMLDMFHEKPEADPAAGAAPLGEARGELVFEHVSFAYRPERTVLKDISFTVPAGRTVAIVGDSGSGKSSLIRLLFRLFEPDSGRILLDGTPISELPLASLRQAIAIVPQDTVLFNDTIGNNIAFGRPGATREEIEHAARVARLDKLIESLPDRYDTLVGERGVKLSGGEKQRVAIARAALKRPRIFVFDEATSSLDTKIEREILQNLMEVARTSTTLVIAHRLSTIIHADEILVLHQGTIIERGTHEDLLEHQGAYAALWQAQQSGRLGGSPAVEAASASVA